MNPEELFRAARLDEAIEALGAEVRRDPSDPRRRTFLFELLCFAGSYDRAEKQLDVLAGQGREAAIGTLLYRSALHAERIRQQMFAAGTYPTGPAPRAVSGTLNGTPFHELTDGDPRIGARLELFAAGQYTWIPLEQVAAVRMRSPRRLRDLLWAPAAVRTTADYPGRELGEVLIPALTPLSSQHPDDRVRLGRVTEWQPLPGDGQARDGQARDGQARDGLAPVGQRLLLTDEGEFPILELRELDIVPASVAVG